MLIGSWGCPNNQFGVYKRPWWSTSRALTGQRPNMRCVDISKRNYFSNHVFKQRGKIFVARVKNNEKALMTRVVWPPEGNEDKMWAKSIPQRSWSRSIAQSDQVWSALVNLGKGKISFTLEQGGRTWQAFGGGKHGHETFRQARNYNFRDKCVVFARNLKFSNLTQ